MGNEASLEGGEGPLSGLPEGLAPDGKGGFVRVSDGTPVNLSELSEEQRRRLDAAVSRAQGRQPGGAAAARRPSESDAHQRSPQAGASRGPTGLSKSRTVDAFNQGPPGRATPGRSPSSLSLFESRFRQEPKDSEPKSTGMFGSSFLSGANPLSAVSSMTSSVSSSISSMGDSVNISKLGLFGDEEEGDASSAPESKQGGRGPGKGPQQGPGPKGPQQGGPQKQGQGPPGQGPRPGQGPPGQGPRQGQGPKPGQGPPGQGPPGQGPRQGQGPPGQGPLGQQGPRPGQGPPGQGPPGQQGPRPGQGPPGQGAKQGGPPQQKGGPPQQGPGKPGPKQQGPQGPGAHPREPPAKGADPPSQQGAGKPAGGLCPLCKTTQLNTGSKDPPNYNNCTECKNQVCSLCGFSPPDSAGKEWLCLNCQMQRAMGGMDPPGMTRPKQGSAPPSPQRQAPGKPGKLLIKQQSTTDQGLTPPTTPRQKSPGPTSPGPLSPGSSLGGSPKIDPKTGRPIQPKSSPQQSPAKAKQESSFFGGLGGISLGGLTDAAKPPAAASQAAESVTGKLFGGFGGLMESSKPQPQAQVATKQEESVTGKLFGGFGGLSDSAKPPAAASQMFSFGSSLLSSATNLVTGEEEKAAAAPPGSPPDSPADSGPGSPPDSDPGSPPDSPFSAPGSPPDSDSAPDTPPAKSKKPPRTISVEQKEKAPPAAEPPPTPAPAPANATKENCPLCNVELNIGSADTPNYSLCTECKKSVCNLCGFNPTPHLGEKEWLCLNCQTQRAMAGQLGDMPPPSMASPKKEPPTPAPVPPSTLTPAAVDSKHLVEAAGLTPPAPETKVVPPAIPATPTDSTLISPSDSNPHPETTPQQTEQTKELEQPLNDESAPENVIHSEQEGHITESVEAAAAEKQQSSSEEMAGDHPHPETQPSDSDQKPLSTTVNEIPAIEQQQSSSEKAAEDHPQPHTEISNVEPTTQSASVIETPAVQQQQGSSENETEALSLPVEGETQNLLRNTGLDKTTVPDEAETEPNPKITEAEAPLADNEKVEPTPEKPPEVTTHSAEPKPASIPEAVTQTASPIQQDPTDINVKEEKILEVSNEKPQIDEAQQTLAVQTPSEGTDTALTVDQKDIATKPEADSVQNNVTAEIKPEPVAPVAPVDKVDVPIPDKAQEELQPEPEKSESPSFVSDEQSVSASGGKIQANERENEPIEKETNVKEEKTLDISNEKPLINEAQQTPPEATDTGLTVDQKDIATKQEADGVQSTVTAEIKPEAEPVAPVAPGDKTDTPIPDKTQEELKPEAEKTEGPSVVSEEQSVSASGGKVQANEEKNKPTEKQTNVKEEKMIEVSNEKPKINEAQQTPAAHTESETIDTALTGDQKDITNKPEIDSTAEIKPEAEPVAPVAPVDKADVPIHDETREELKPEKSEGPSVVSEEQSVSPSEGKVQANEEESKSTEKQTNVKDEKIIEVPNEKPIINETQQTPAAQTEPEAIDTTLTVDQKDTDTKPEADGVQNTVTAEIKPEAEPVAPEAPVDKADVPIPDKEELKPESDKCIESESPTAVSDAPASERKIQANEGETKPTEKETEQLLMADNSTPFVPSDRETKALEKANEGNIVENKVSQEAINYEETAMQRIPEGPDEETSVEIKTNAAAERAIEVKADVRKASEEEPAEQKIVENTNDEKPREECANIARLSPALNCAENETVCPVIEKNESEPAAELALTVPEEMQKEEIQMHKEIEQATNDTPAGKNLAETVSLPDKVEDKKSMCKTESVSQKEENQTPEEAVLKEEVNTVPSPADSKEQKKVSVEVSERSVETSLSPSVISETQAIDKACEEKLFQDEAEADSQKTNSSSGNQHAADTDTFALTDSDEKQREKVAEVSIKETEAEHKKKEDETQPVAGNILKAISVSEKSTVCDRSGTAESEVGENKVSKADEVSEAGLENGSVSVSVASVPVAEPETPVSVVIEQEKGQKEENADMETKEEAKVLPLEKFIDEDAVSEVKTVETLKETGMKEAPVNEGSPTSPSDLAKLESTVLPILEAQTTAQEEEKRTDTLKTRRKLEVLPLSPDSPSSEEDRELSEKTFKGTTKKKLLVPMDVRADSLEDSSESFGKESPMSGDDEEFIRKQIIEMSENEDASPSDEENIVRQKIREQEKRQMDQKKTDTVEKSLSGKTRRLTKKTTISPDDEDNEIHISLAEHDKEKEEGLEPKEEQRGTAVRKFQTMELNATSSPLCTHNDEGEPEMESLTDSPDDRSRGEGSSSLHASSFTPGTSPTSLSSLDEDSDSSSPSHARAGEGKQHRKAKHRQPGQMLPTIEDSSEEEELREEEELLREQEKQKGSGKKSKKDKEEIRAQRRRERPKTPPSNLSPIEDASPTEELRQEAEMEEIRRSSCSDFSPSIESDPEGFEIHAAKIAAVQKTYQLPISVSLHSPTDDENTENVQKKPLKSADEAYEEIMLRAKSPTTDKGEIQPQKESLYGGMLIEDYAYSSLIDNSTTDLGEPEKIIVPAQPKKLRSPDEVYEDMIKKRKEFMQLEQEYQKMQPKSTTPEIVLQPAETTFFRNSTITLDKDGKPLLDAETAYEELMKRVLTPGTSPTQQGPEVEATASRKALHPIPDLKVTQCSSGEVSSDEEYSAIKKEDEITAVSDVSAATDSEPVKDFSQPPSSSTSNQEPHTTITASQADIVDLSNAFPRTSTPVISSVSPLPTVPQYTPSTPSVVSTAPPIPPKPNVLRRDNSQEKAEEAVAPLPPPTPPKPTVFPRKPPVPLPPQASATSVRPETVAMNMTQGPSTRPAVTPTYKPHVPPPVPPKPSIPAGIGDSHRPGHSVKPPIAPKPGSQPSSPAHTPHPPRPTVLPTSPSDTVLNLSPSSESKTFQPSPSSPRYARNLRDTYVVITLPSQPSSPVDNVTTQAPSSPSPASSAHQPQPESYQQPHPQPQSYSQQHQQTVPPQQTRVPLAYTRVTESIESQEICGPEKHVSSSCHIIEAISASAQAPVVMPNLISQVVTTEVQRTTVSVVHERTTPPVPAPRANGVPISMEKPKPQVPAQNGHGFQPSEVVDLRTMKVDPGSDMNGVDLSASPDSRRQSFVTDVSRQNSAVQSPVVNLSAESSTVSIVTDSITIVTCAATIQRCDNVDTSQASSMPLQLTKNKAFEPVSQIIYRPIDSQPSTHATAEIPINLSVGSSTGGGAFQSTPITIAPTSVPSCVANGLTTGITTVAGAVDLSTTKPFNTLVSVDAASAEVLTAVVTDDGKPVDLTAGKKSVCCDVVYKFPFTGSCTTQQPTTPLPEDRFGYRDDHYQYDRSPYGMRGFGGIKPSMSDTNLAEAGLFLYKSKNSYNFSGTTEGAVDLTSAKISDAGEAVDYSKKGTYAGMTIPPYSQARVTSAVGTLFGTSSVLRSSNGVVYSSVAAPIPSTYAITTQPGSIFSTTYNTLSGMHTSDTMPSLSNLQNLPLTRSQSFLSTISITATEEQGDAPLNLEISRVDTTAVTTATTSLSLDTYTDASLEAIAASLEALSSPMVPGDGQYQAERERLEMEKLKQQRLAEELEWERQEIQRFREQEQILVQKELEELQVMKQQILAQQEEERQAHLMMQKETYAQQQQQLEQIQRLQEQLRMQLEEQKLRQMYPGGDTPGRGLQEAVVLGPDGTVLARKITDSGCQTDEEDETVSKAYTAGRKKRSVKKSVDSCVQTDDEDQEEWEAQTRSRQTRPRTARGDRGGHSEMSLQAHTEISIQTDTEGNIIMDTRMELSDSERTSPKKRPTPLEIGQSPNLKADSSTLQAPPKSPKVLYSPISPCISPSKSLEFVSYDKSLGDTSPQKLRGSTDPSKTSPASPRGSKSMQRSMSDPKPMSPTGEERGSSGTQYGDSYTGKGSGGTPTGTQKKVKRTLPNPPSEDESTTTGQTAYSTGSARRRMCRNSNMARAKILQDIDRELDLVERESSKLRKRQAELDEEEKEIDAKLRYLEMGINRRKDALLKEREKRERAYLQSVAEDRDYMSDSEVSNIRETRGGLGAGEDEEIESHGLERPRTAPQSELDDFEPPQTKHEYEKYQYQYNQTQYQQSLYQTPQSYQSHSIYSSVPSLTTSQQQSYHQMLLLQQKAARQAALLSELDATKYDVISRQPDPTSSAYLGVKYDKYGNHLDLRALEVGSIASSPMSAVSDSYYTDVDHHTPRSYMLLEDAAELAKGSTGLSSSYSLAERELAKAEKLLRRSAADLGSTDYLGSTSRLHTFGKTPDEEDTMEEPYELKLLKQQLKQEFRRSTGGTENLEQLTGLSQHYYTPSTSISSYSQRHYPKTDKYSISRLTLEKQAAKQLPASMLYQKHKTPLLDPKISSKYSSITDSRGLETDYTSYLGSTSASPRSSRLMQDEITFGLRKNIAEQQKYLGSTLGANLAGSLNLGQSLGLDSAYPSGSRSRPSSRPTSCYGLDLSIKRDPSSSSLRLKGDGEASGDVPSYQTPSGRTKPTSLPIVQSGRGRIPIVAQNSEEESPLSPVGQPMGMARASAGPLPPISADSRDQFGSCLSLQESQQQQHIREEPTRGRGYVLLDDLQGTMSDSEAYHLRREETDWFDKPRDGRSENGQEKRQGKGPYYPFPHLRVKLQRDPKDRSVSGNGLGIRIVGGKEVPGSNGDIGAYVAKVLPGGAAEQTGKILEGMQVLEWNGVLLTGKTYEEVQGLVGQPCNEADVCVRLDLNMLAESEGSHHLDFQEPSKGDRPPRSPGVDPKQLAAELQKVSQQQAPTSTSSSSLPANTSATSSPGQPGSPSVSKKRHSSKTSEGTKTQSHPISGEIQLQIHYDKQLGNLIVHVLQARNLAARDNNGYSDPFVKVYLLPGRGQVMVVQNASAENKRKSKHAGKSVNPEWNQTVIYKNIHLEQLRKKTLEVSVWDYDKCSSNDFLGEVLIDLSNTAQLDNVPRWLPLKEQSEGEHHRRSHSSQGRHGSSKPSSQHSSPKTGSSHDNQDSPKSSVIKSRSHGIFPDPSKDTQVPTIEKCHSSPGTSKPSPSEGQSQSHGHSQHSRSHGASRSSKSAARQHHQDGSNGSGGGAAIATGDAQQQPQQQQPPPQRLQPSQRGRLSLRHQRHSVVGVLTIQRAQSDWLPPLPSIVSAKGSRADGRHLTLRKAVSEERPQSTGARSSYRSSDAPVTAASLDSGLSGSAYSLLDEEGETNEVDSAIFQVPRFGKIPNGTDAVKPSMGLSEMEGKTQVMGEIKIALKKEVKTEGEHLVLEILQCRNITYKFKTPDHLPDLYVKLYVVNIATQKRIIKKKTRVCRHDREPSFNETFRFCMNPTGHSIQLFLVSNGGKFVKKTLIGEAYVWLDKVDLRKRVVSWHKLLASTAQIHS
ncbi:protein piccolo isoform X3 [Mugil cephalus]|uniref:protein piccolo isoform X3 n=1 Tax=Mugil cephalus TaxID=48193 RepID=UPI001FB6B58F|nr:protein piccolo isoform X3 [Mugil cephalus]